MSNSTPLKRDRMPISDDVRRDMQITGATATVRRTWLKRLAAFYGVDMPAPAAHAQKISLDDLDAAYIQQLREQHGLTQEQVARDLTGVRVKLFEWAARMPEYHFQLRETLTFAVAQEAVAYMLMPLIDMHIYDDMQAFTHAVLACLTAPALADLVREQRLAYVQAADALARCRVALVLARQLGAPDYREGIRNLIMYLLDEQRWRRGLAQYALFKRAQGPFVAPTAYYYNRQPGPQQHDGARFLVRLLGISAGEITADAAGGVTADMADKLLHEHDDALLRQVWQQLTTP